MVFRIEDTDKERSRKEYEENIIECLSWLGIKYDSGPFRQSERNDLYKKYIEALLKKGSAYISQESEGDRKEVIRFKNPNKKIKFNDLIRGEVEMDTTDLGDFVIARNLEEPLYHLTVVVDDYEMKITHIIRGEDGIANTPRQILIQEGIGAPRPIYAHIPLILASDRSKLSGRHGAVSVSEFRDMGYLPEAFINFLALIGWNPGGEQEIFSLEELIEKFSLEKVHKAGAIFNIEKLNWFNKKYIEKLSDESFISHTKKFIPESLSSDQVKKSLPLMRDKISYFGEIPELMKGELSFISSVSHYPKEKLMWKQEKDIGKTKENLQSVLNIIENISEKDFVQEKIKEAIWPAAEKEGRGNVLWPMRYALSGKEKSPDPFIMSAVIGKKETLERLTKALNAI